MHNDEWEMVDKFEVEFSDLSADEPGSRLEAGIMQGLRFFQRSEVARSMHRIAFCSVLVLLILVLNGSNIFSYSNPIIHDKVVRQGGTFMYVGRDATSVLGQDVTVVSSCPTVDFVGVGTHWVAIGSSMPSRVVFDDPQSPISYDKVLSKYLSPECLRQFYNLYNMTRSTP